MTNDEKNRIRILNVRWTPSFRTSAFVIPSSFVIRHSSLFNPCLPARMNRYFANGPSPPPRPASPPACVPPPGFFQRGPIALPSFPPRLRCWLPPVASLWSSSLAKLIFRLAHSLPCAAWCWDSSFAPIGRCQPPRSQRSVSERASARSMAS